MSGSPYWVLMYGIQEDMGEGLDGKPEWVMRAWEWGQGTARDSKKGKVLGFQRSIKGKQMRLEYNDQ